MVQSDTHSTLHDSQTQALGQATLPSSGPVSVLSMCKGGWAKRSYNVREVRWINHVFDLRYFQLTVDLLGHNPMASQQASYLLIS